MKKPATRSLVILGIIVLIVGIGFMIPRLRKHDTSVPKQFVKEIMVETSISFDAPLLELISLPTYRIMSFQRDIVKVGIYSWFGVRVATVTFNECNNLKEGITGVQFACGGSHNDYRFGF